MTSGDADEPVVAKPRRCVVAACLGLAVIAAATPAARAGKGSPARPHVSVSYRELLDPETIVRTREKLVDVLARPDRRDVLQPFLDPYSALLPYAVQMLYGADAVPQQDLAARYAAGGAQPAWVAILRAGKIAVTSDGQGRARVFLPGDDPRAAYRRAYSVLRHPLSTLLPAGGKIEVEVFAYRNDYASAELTLFTVPYRFRARAFPPQGVPLDLAGLERFFQQEGRLEGAELAPGEGLYLYASRGPRPTLSGRPVTLADFAVAYRAVFHAGDTEAFVSLDRHPDPTLAAVNFGGLLEDTRVGEVLLTADKRFKTICSGLDPVTHADIREQTRRAVPTFLINAERSFLADRRARLPAGLSGSRRGVEGDALLVLSRFLRRRDRCRGAVGRRQPRPFQRRRGATGRRRRRPVQKRRPRYRPGEHPRPEPELRPLRRRFSRGAGTLHGGAPDGDRVLAAARAAGVARSGRFARRRSAAGKHAPESAAAHEPGDADGASGAARSTGTTCRNTPSCGT